MKLNFTLKNSGHFRLYPFLLIALTLQFRVNILAQTLRENKLTQDKVLLGFIENKGQWDSRVKFRGEVSNGAIFLKKDGYTVVQYNPADLANAMLFEQPHGRRFEALEQGGKPSRQAMINAKLIDHSDSSMGE